jgi:peptidoglycan/LPS O-acetylase OafA/YrhL
MWLSGGRARWWEVTLGSLAMVLPLAWLSWHGVEKWALRWVRRRPRTAVATAAMPESIASGS